MEKYKNYFFIVIGIIVILNFLNTCSVNSKLNTVSKAVKQLDTIVARLETRPFSLTDIQTRDAVKDECMETMYKYLIYETDLDKAKTSLSQIRSDIDRLKSGQ